MPMSPDVLGPMLKDAASSVDPDQFQDDPEAARDAMFRAFAEAIITHIQTAAVVTVASVSGVTTGVGVSGPGTGTIT